MAEVNTRRSRITTLAIVAFWLVMTTLLFKREVLPRIEATWAESRSATYASLLDDLPRHTRTRMAMFWLGKRVGHTTVTARRIGERYILGSRTEIETGVLANLFLIPRRGAEGAVSGEATGITIHTETVVGPKFHLISFQAAAKARPDMRELARMGARMAGDKLHLTVTDYTGKRFETELPFDPSAVMSEGFNTAVDPGDLVVGRRWQMRIVNPITGSVSRATAEVLRQENLEWNGTQHLTFVVQVTYDKVQTTSWVTPEGDVLRQTVPFGIVLIREVERRESADNP